MWIRSRLKTLKFTKFPKNLESRKNKTENLPKLLYSGGISYLDFLSCPFWDRFLCYLCRTENHSLTNTDPHFIYWVAFGKFPHPAHHWLLKLCYVSYWTISFAVRPFVRDCYIMQTAAVAVRNSPGGRHVAGAERVWITYHKTGTYQHVPSNTL